MMRLLKRRSAALPASVPADATLQPGRNVFVARCDGAAVLLDLKSEVYFGLDDVADAIWRGIESGRTVREIAAALSEEYDAGVEVLQADTQRFVAELMNRRLVVRA